jgi:hypothetical protein
MLILTPNIVSHNCVNSKDLLEYIQSRSLSSCNSIKTFDLYTTIPHSKPKDTLRELVQLCFIKKRMTNVEINTLCYEGKGQILFYKKNHTDSTKNLSENHIINMLEFFIDNIFIIFGGSVFSTDSRHTFRYKLSSSSRRLVPCFA